VRNKTNRPRGGRRSQFTRFRGGRQLSSMVRVVENRNDVGSITTGVDTITARTDVIQEVQSPSSLMSSHGFESPSPDTAQRRDTTSARHDPLDEFEYPFIVTRMTDVVQEVESPSSLMSSHGFESPSPEQLALRRRNSTSAQLDPLDEFGLSSSLPFRPRPLLL
jgi:hypothetical protein